MKSIALGLAAAALAISAAYAADAWKTGDTKLGKVWTDANGMTLYTFDKDAKDKSSCNGDCAKKWPPLAAAADAKAEDEWTVVKRDDGSMMWAYDGHPLYTFVNDKKAGDVNGEGIAGVWHVAKAD